jgi:small subunit ribosomal protein S1
MESKSSAPAEQMTYQPPTEEDDAPAAVAPADGVLRENQIVKARVTRLTAEAAFVSIRHDLEASLALAELARPEGEKPVAVGDELEVLVEQLPEESGKLVVSKDKADKIRRWDAVAARCTKGSLVEGTVVARVTGGYSVDIGVRAFLPSAQADLRRLGDPDSLVGEKLEFGVSQFDKRRGNIVLSRKALLEKEREERKKQTLARLAEGAQLDGVVKTVTDYGAFIDLGGIDGLLHVTEMSWGRIGHPRELLTVGQEVRVTVLKYDEKAGKIGLGLKQLREDPWARAAEKYAKGSKVKGKVVGFADYGAFVAVEPGVEGLLHVSEMSWTRRIKHPSKELSQGQEIEAQVLEVDPKARRLSLGLRQLQQNPWTQVEEKFPIGTVIRSQVNSVADFGIFVEVTEGIDGLVHVSDLSWTQRVKHPSELYKKGDEVEVVVLSIDVENERLALGIKQLQSDPWLELETRHPIGSKVKGKVTRVVDFGVFVEIEPGMEGLVHVSELREERVENPADLVKPGDELEAQVLDLDGHDRRIALSVRALTHVPEDYRDYLAKQSGGTVRLGDVLGDKLKPR